MEPRATVELFEFGNKYHITVEPRMAVAGIRRHLAAQHDELELFEPQSVGDLGVTLLNGKTIYNVLEGAASVIAVHTTSSK